MTNSDIIAIAALVISVISASISFWNNSANIKAKRAEIALEKRLEALRQIYEMISNHENIMRDILFPIPPREQDVYKQSHDTFTQIYNSNRVFVPPHIDELIFSYHCMLDEHYLTLYPGHQIDWDDLEVQRVPFGVMEDTRNASKEILAEIQKFIGLK